MNTKLKSLFTLTGVTLTAFATLALSNVSHTWFGNHTEFCSHVENVVLVQELPASHPVNKCAAKPSQGISWSEWFTGRSSSYQFHFIDLLELLSRSASSEATNPDNPVIPSKAN